MRKTLLIFTLAAGTLTAAQPHRNEHRWLKRLSAVAVCAVSGADLATTAVGVSRGGIEQNGLLSHGGKPRWGLMAAVNIGACGGAIVAAVAPVPAWLAVTGGAAYSAPKARAVAHNLGELGR
jgi:hypothetical protein